MSVLLLDRRRRRSEADYGNVRVSEIWDSQEQLNAFGDRLMPLLAEIGIDPGQPETYEVHNTIRR